MINHPRFSKFLFLLFLPFWACHGAGDGLSGDSAASDAANAVRFEVCSPDGYDLSCIKDEKTATSDDLLDLLSNAKDAAVEVVGKPVSDARQDKYGENMKRDVGKEYQMLPNHPRQIQLEGILRKVLKQRISPSKIDYNIYVIEADMVNAFTVGGEIFVTESLLRQSESLDELACVIGHEVGHNELGHIAQQLKTLEFAQGILGEETGQLVVNILEVVTIAFNQKSEAAADLYGIDLALAAGYDACRGIDFWRRMSKLDGSASDLDNFTRSHPYSERRVRCYQSHLETAHHYVCQN